MTCVAGGKSQEDNEGTAGLIRTLSDDLSNTFLKDNELLEIDWFPQAYVPQASKKARPSKTSMATALAALVQL